MARSGMVIHEAYSPLGADLVMGVVQRQCPLFWYA